MRFSRTPCTKSQPVKENDEFAQRPQPRAHTDRRSQSAEAGCGHCNLWRGGNRSHDVRVHAILLGAHGYRDTRPHREPVHPRLSKRQATCGVDTHSGGACDSYTQANHHPVDSTGIDSRPSCRTGAGNSGVDTTRIDAHANRRPGATAPGVNATPNASAARLTNDDSAGVSTYGIDVVEVTFARELTGARKPRF